CSSDLATVLGWSPEPAERVAAARQGAIDDAPPRAADVARAVELLVLAAPPAANLQLLVGLEPHIGAGALVTDVGSVKRAIVARADGLRIGPRFAGGHPLAGTHAHGVAAARDATRLAASEPALWTEIFLMNRDELLPALRSLEEPLGELERALETGNARAVTAWLRRAAQWRQQADA